MSEYLWNEKNNKFTSLISLYNPFKALAYAIRIILVFLVDLQILLVCSLKFNLSSMSTPESFTDKEDLVFLFPISTCIRVLSDLSLSKGITGN